jgi:hypothetical protein
MKALALLGLFSATASAQTPRFEVGIVPVSVQLNGMFTQHVGTFGSIALYVRDHLALQLTGGGNWYNAESAFNLELVEKFRVEAQTSSSLLWTWGVFGGVEVEPFVGELAAMDGVSAKVGLVLSVGAGAGGTRHQLRPAGTTPATWGDTGVRFMGTFSLGARVQLGDHVALRLAVRDVLYSARVTRVNGCVLDEDPFALEDWQSGCRLDFADLGPARNLLREPGSDVINNLGLSLGLGFLF